MQYRASVIISVYNNVNFLKLVLDSLKLQTEQNFEIIISEDACHDNMREFVETYDFTNDFRHIRQKDEGWRKNRALNNAIRVAKSEWLIFIDGDCVLHHRFIEMHLRFASEKNILAGKRIKFDAKISEMFCNSLTEALNKSQKTVLKKIIAGKGTNRFIEEGIFISPDSLFGFLPKLRSVKQIIGSNMSFSRSAIYAINGFDEDYILPAVGEDTDLTWRFTAAGYNIKSVRNFAIQYHLFHPEIWNDDTENMQKMRQKQRENTYFCKNGLN